MTVQRAEFTERTKCINCGSDKLSELSRGSFGQDPVRTYIQNDPWGESPLPYIENDSWIFLRCDVCSQMFHKRILSPAWNEKRFSDWMNEEAMRRFEALNSAGDTVFQRVQKEVTHILRLEKMTQKLRSNEPVRIMDFGCGWGEFLALGRFFGFCGLGIDRSEARRHGACISSIFPDLESLKKSPEAAKGVHAVTMFEVLEHLDDPLETLLSIREVLVPQGVLVLETPNCTGVTNIKTVEDFHTINPIDHINCFTPETLRSMAARAGFRPVMPAITHVTFDFVPVVKNEIKRWIGGFLPPSTRQYFRKF